MWQRADTSTPPVDRRRQAVFKRAAGCCRPSWPPTRDDPRRRLQARSGINAAAPAPKQGPARGHAPAPAAAEAPPSAVPATDRATPSAGRRRTWQKWLCVVTNGSSSTPIVADGVCFVPPYHHYTRSAGNQFHSVCPSAVFPIGEPGRRPPRARHATGYADDVPAAPVSRLPHLVSCPPPGAADPPPPPPGARACDTPPRRRGRRSCPPRSG